jgi:multidrug efflux pump subunit AcrA (membrane-fusion protein)
LIVENGVVRSRKVKIGFKSIEMSEILDGLNEGDLAILSDQDLFKSGQGVNYHLRASN